MMTTYVVKLIVEGRNTQVRVDANDAGAAAKLARDMYSGNSVRVLETSKAK